MLPQIKYMPVNWVDGMKISRTHLQHLENAISDHIRDAAGVRMTNYNYGLLPTGIAARQSLDLHVFHDSSGYLKVKVLECRAITPGGVRIEITPQSKPVESGLALNELKAQAYELIIVADPFTRVPFGQPDPEESSIRQPYTTAHYRLDIVPFPRTAHPEFSAYSLCVGRLRVDGEVVKLSEQYIPPCTQTASHARLMAIHGHLLAMMGNAEVTITEIHQKFLAKSSPVHTEKGILELARQSSFFLANHLDTVRLTGSQQPPVFLVECFMKWARVINTTLNNMLRKDREDLLNYIHSWFELAPREFENMLRSLLSTEYDHNDPLEALVKVEAFAGRMLKLLQKMAELHPSEGQQKPKIAGWLVLNSANRSRQAFAISTENVVVGREETGQNHCDIAIPGDLGISRRHVRINVTDSNGHTEFSITDLNSANGIYVHDTDTRLKANQTFTLVDGDTRSRLAKPTW